MTAELLAGLVLSQLMHPGTPVVLGSLPAYFDMRSMTSGYTPHSFQLNLACAEMMVYYDLPHCGSSGSGTGWGADLPASNALWMNHLTSCLGKVGLAPFVAGNFDSLAFSPTTAVYADQIIRQARSLAGGFDLDDDAVNLDDIAHIGPAGDFLGSDATFRLFRSFQEESPLWPALSLDDWTAQGSPRAEDLLRERTRKILLDLKSCPDHDDLIARGEAFIKHSLA